jgi:hypothetical protein
MLSVAAPLKVGNLGALVEDLVDVDIPRHSLLDRLDREAASALQRDQVASAEAASEAGSGVVSAAIEGSVDAEELDFKADAVGLAVLRRMDSALDMPPPMRLPVLAAFEVVGMVVLPAMALPTAGMATPGALMTEGSAGVAALTDLLLNHVAALGATVSR